MTAVTQTEAFAKLDEGTVKDFIAKVIYSALIYKDKHSGLLTG